MGVVGTPGRVRGKVPRPKLQPAIPFSRVAFDLATPDIFQAATGGLGADSTVMTLALMGFQKAAPPGANQNIFTTASGTNRFSVTILSTGAMRATVLNAAGASVGRIETNASVCNGLRHDILMSSQTDQVTQAAANQVYVDGLSARNDAGSWTGGTVDWDYALTEYRLGNSDFELGAFYLNTAARVDLSAEANRSRFASGAMQWDGAGPTGAAPVILLSGNAVKWNAVAGLNDGSGGKFVKQGSAAVVDV